eukprot:tig00020995_g16919.t1
MTPPVLRVCPAPLLTFDQAGRPNSLAALNGIGFASRAVQRQGSQGSMKPPADPKMQHLIDVVLAAMPTILKDSNDDEEALSNLIAKLRMEMKPEDDDHKSKDERPSEKVKKDAQVVLRRIEDKRLEKRVHCAQIAPATFVSIAEEFDLPPGSIKPAQLVQALHKIGFDHVFDLRFAADVTIMEEASELLEKIKSGGKFPMFTSCCAGWQRLVEEDYPDLIDHVSSCKSPMGMNSALIKSMFAERSGIDVSQIVVTSIMPCSIKKVEAQRPQLQDPISKTDHVITTREIGQIFRAMNIDWDELDGSGPTGQFASWMGAGTGAGAIFGVTGGVMEAAVRTAYEFATGKTLEKVEVRDARGLFGVKEGERAPAPRRPPAPDAAPAPRAGALDVPGVGELKFCVVCGLTSIKRIMEMTRAGECPFHFVEIMMCQNGCISGPGQPKSKDKGIAKKRMQALYTSDERAVVRKSHENPAVKALYQEYLGKPLGEKSHHLLHTEFWPNHVKPENGHGHGHGHENGNGNGHAHDHMEKKALDASFSALTAGMHEEKEEAAHAEEAKPAAVVEYPPTVEWTLPPKAIRIIYGSETGNAESLARVVAKECAARGIAVKCTEADELEMDDLATVSTLIVVVSTAGQGEIPDNAKDFWTGISSKKHPPGWLRNLHYSVMGIGDSSYAHFNRAAVEIEERLAELGAHRFLARGVGDDQDEERFETGFEKWAPEAYKTLKLPPVKDDGSIPLPSHHVFLTAGPKEGGARKFDETWKPIVTDPMGQLIRVESNVRITPDGYDRDVRHIVFEVDQVPEPLKYTVGDALAIYARNDPEEVKAFLKFYALEPSDLITFKLNEHFKGDAKAKPPMGPQTSLLDYVRPPRRPAPLSSPAEACAERGLSGGAQFCDCVDVFGRPNLRFFGALAKFATDVHQRDELDSIARKTWRGTAAFSVLLKDLGHVTYAGVLQAYPSARPPLAQLLDMIPAIKPRYYSIASSPHVAVGKLELSIVIVDWEKPDKSVGFGTCTGYLRQLVDGPHWISVALKPGVGICMPPHPSTPIVMAGLGTGLAPMRAMVQERSFQVDHGKRVGWSVLFFGCRHSKGDYLYSDRWDEFVAKGALSHLRVAFSRDGPKKVYIQDKIAAEPELLYEAFVKRGGYFFFCGPAGRVPQDIRAAIETAMSEGGKEDGFTREMASKYIDEMRKTSRYIVEAWS